MPLSYVTSLTPQSNFPTCSPLSSFQIPCISTNSQKTCPTAIHHHHHALQIIITSNVHPSPISHLIPIKSHHPPLAKSNQKPTTSPLRSHSCMYVLLHSIQPTYSTSSLSQTKRTYTRIQYPSTTPQQKPAAARPFCPIPKPYNIQSALLPLPPLSSTSSPVSLYVLYRNFSPVWRKAVISHLLSSPLIRPLHIERNSQFNFSHPQSISPSPNNQPHQRLPTPVMPATSSPSNKSHSSKSHASLTWSIRNLAFLPPSSLFLDPSRMSWSCQINSIIKTPTDQTNNKPSSSS